MSQMTAAFAGDRRPIRLDATRSSSHFYEYLVTPGNFLTQETIRLEISFSSARIIRGYLLKLSEHQITPK
ncbi:MAG: hypothetical protein WStaBPW_00300 [Shewanella algae]|nr:hypothetical protein TUM17384_30760 [Shewanella algae]BCV64481.1 hypothetical protein TUM17386_41520 [Shewanella algae]